MYGSMIVDKTVLKQLKPLKRYMWRAHKEIFAVSSGGDYSPLDEISLLW
jgi:hypothetical protein